MVEGQTVVDMFPAGPGMLLYTQPGMLIAVVAPAELAVNTLLPYSVAVGLPETTNFAEFGGRAQNQERKKVLEFTGNNPLGSKQKALYFPPPHRNNVKN